MSDPPFVRLREIARLYLRMGCTAFGGPLAHVSLFRDEVVERRQWVSEREFADAFGVTNLLPGPNSSELAVHTGYLVRGVRGGVIAGLCFATPAVVLMLLLSAWYFDGPGLRVRQELFGGLRAVVIAVIAHTLWRLRGSAGGWWLGGLAALVGLLTLVAPAYEPAWLVAAATAGWLRWDLTGRRDRMRLRRRGDGGFLLAEIAWVFLRTGLLLVGGGFALVPLLHPVVIDHGWLTSEQFLDGIAIGQLTPGPIVTSVAFVGYAAAGLPGGIVATCALYLPAFLFVLAGTGPFLRRFARAPWLRPTVDAVTAAALGAIAAAGADLATDAVAAPGYALVALVALVALARKVPAWAVALGGLAVGVVVALS